MKSKPNQKRINLLQEVIREMYSDGENYVCQLCGFKHATRRPFDFHHINPSDKKYKVSKMGKDYYSFETIRREIEKCIFICSNCHRIIHETLVVGDKKKVVEEADQLNLF